VADFMKLIFVFHQEKIGSPDQHTNKHNFEVRVLFCLMVCLFVIEKQEECSSQLFLNFLVCLDQIDSCRHKKHNTFPYFLLSFYQILLRDERSFRIISKMMIMMITDTRIELVIFPWVASPIEAEQQIQQESEDIISKH
jgi:hypothetical protein